MAKKNSDSAAAFDDTAFDGNEDTAPKPSLSALAALPEGYEDRSAEPVGTWDFEHGPCHFIPEFCRLVDSTQDDKKCSTLCVGELIDPCKVKNKDDELIEAQKGDLVLVWVTPGMRAVLLSHQIPTFIRYKGEQDTGKKNPMRTFFVGSPKGSPKRMVPLADDFRKTSKDAKHAWSNPALNKALESQEAPF